MEPTTATVVTAENLVAGMVIDHRYRVVKITTSSSHTGTLHLVTTDTDDKVRIPVQPATPFSVTEMN